MLALSAADWLARAARNVGLASSLTGLCSIVDPVPFGVSPLEFILLLTWWVFCVTCGGVTERSMLLFESTLEMHLCLSLD